MQGAKPTRPAPSCRRPLIHPHTHPPAASGTIPACLSNFTNLEWLALDGNSLRGTIPESLCTIGPFLIHLDLDTNELTGA